MSHQLTLPDELYSKLAQGAAQRGLSVESLLGVFSELVAVPRPGNAADRKRSATITRLMEKFCAGPLTRQDRAELDRLIGEDYSSANSNPDKIMAAKLSSKRTGT